MDSLRLIPSSALWNEARDELKPGPDYDVQATKAEQAATDPGLNEHLLPTSAERESGASVYPQEPGEVPVEDGPIEVWHQDHTTPEDPYPTPEELQVEWSPFDVMDNERSEELHVFLRDNYVEDDDDGTFRFRYTSEFLRWALSPPGYHSDWHLALRNKATKELVGFVAAIPVLLRVRKHTINAREYNFLCVHKEWRGKRLCPLLLKEAKRRADLKGVHQAVWTSGTLLPNPVSTCRTYHRSLKYEKLVDIGFAAVPSGSTLEEEVESHKAPDRPALLDRGLREMEEKDVLAVRELYERYMRRFDAAFEFNEEDIRHQYLSSPKDDVGQVIGPDKQFMWAYVIEDPESHKITDFFSFYSLPATVLIPNAPQHNVLNSAYLYHYASSIAFEDSPETSTRLKQRLTELVGDAVVLAQSFSFDVFNALTLMDNVEFLESLQFATGTGFLKYYIDNWRTAPLSGMNSEGDVPIGRGIGIVML